MSNTDAQGKTAGGERTPAWRLAWSGPVLVLVLSGAAYLLAYAYESSFCNHFGIPPELISTNITTLLIWATGTLVVTTYAYLYAELFHMAWSALPQRLRPNLHDPIWRRNLVSLLASGLAAFYILSVSSGPLMPRLLFALGFIVVGAMGLWVPLIAYRGKGTYRAKLEAYEKAEDELITFSDRVVRKWGRGSPVTIALLAFAMFLLAFLFSSWAGSHRARRQEEFFVIPGSPEVVVLRIYGDKIICAPFNKDSKSIDGTLVIYSLSKNAPLALKRETIGPLRLLEEE